MLIFSSFAAPLREYFEGYCFVGSDVLVGHEGLRLYQHEREEDVPGSHDGCYTKVARLGSDWEVSTDAKGMGRIFKYENDGDWAVSSSFYGLVKHVRKHGKRLSLRPSMLRPFAIRHSFTHQLASSRTAFDEISLVPSDSNLKYKGGQWKVTPKFTNADISYEEGIRRYLSAWLGRLSAVIKHDESFLDGDLSGGLDSRTVFSFFLSLRDNVAPDRYRLASNPRLDRDFEVASLLAEYYGVSLNSRRAGTIHARSAEDSLARWRENSLGVYLPVYFPRVLKSMNSWHMHGGGGENYRTYYSDSSIQQRVERYRPLLSEPDFTEWADSILGEEASREKGYLGEDALQWHYREFRNRLHFGHAPHHKFMFTPLNSRLLDEAAYSLSPKRRSAIYFDIMESLAPGLVMMPYDEGSKYPTIEQVSRLRAFKVNDIPSGAIFGESEIPANRHHAPSHAIKDAWLSSAKDALSNSSVRDFLQKEQSEKFSHAYTSLSESDGPLPPHDRGVLDLSYVHLIAFCLDEYVEYGIA